MMSASSGSAMSASVQPEATNAHQVAQALAQDAQAVRFKKLLIYGCTGIWETQPDRLEAIQFCDLLHSLRLLAPTWRDLQTCLVQNANRLNKSAEYTLVAHRLVELLQPLYADAEAQPAIDPQLYAAIARQLAAEPDLLRLKKLLLLACTNQWESDRDKLTQTEILPLIQRLHSLTLTPAGLDFFLDSLVKTLSKPAEYRLLADRLMQAFQPLYPDAKTVPEQPIVVEDSNAGSAAISARSSPATKFATIAEATAALSALLDEQNKRSQPAAPVAQNRLADSEHPLHQRRRSGLRQIVIQSSNPLRTKILLFSLLHEPFQIQHESLLKDHDLDDLLHMMLQSYPQPADLKSALHHTANRLPDAAAYLPSVNALLQAMQQWGGDSCLSADPSKGTIAAAAPTTPEGAEATRYLTGADSTQCQPLPPVC